MYLCSLHLLLFFARCILFSLGLKFGFLLLLQLAFCLHKFLAFDSFLLQDRGIGEKALLLALVTQSFVESLVARQYRIYVNSLNNGQRILGVLASVLV